MKVARHGRFAGRVFLCWVLLCGNVFAAEQSLSDTRTWHKLVYYEESGDTDSGYLSASISDEFFLAEDGRSSPEKELAATLAALAAPPESNPNLHAQCRFPARYLWLKNQSRLSGVDDIDCPDFDAWIFGGQTDSMSIVFVTGYLGNPASYYGHTLLKFNSSKQRKTSDLLDTTVNYGAIIPPGVGPINYMYNGATGGFNAGFSHIEYYFHDHNYGERELRDLWEYELDLSPDEVQFVLAHAWEVLGKEYVYYFFRKNCAYRMAEVVEIIDGVDLIPPRRGWTVPQSVISRTSDSRINGKPLVRKVKYYPSRQSTFYAKFRGLTEEEKTALRGIVDQPEDEYMTSTLGTLSIESRSKILDTALDYYQYRMPNDESAPSELRDRYRDLVVRRFRLPPTKAASADPPQRGPEDDRPPGYASVGFAYNDELGDTALLRVRPAYYDALDASVSHVPNSELSMAEVTLRVGDDGVSISEASLFRVEAVNGSVSGLAGDNGRSWALGLGAFEQSPGCTDCLVARFEGDIGRSTPLGRGAVVGAYLGGAIQDSRNGQGNLFARASVWLNLTSNDRFRLQARYESRYHLDGFLDFEDIFSINGRVALSRQYDLRFSARKNTTTEIALGIGYYW